MKKVVILVSIAATVLAGCESKREICAKTAAGEYTDFWLVSDKLGIGRNADVMEYCEYYKR